MVLSRTRLALVMAASALVVVPASASADQEIPGQYIVVLKSSSGGAATDNAKERVRSRGGRVQREYGRVLKGFSAKLDAKALADIRKDPAVDYVEPDRVITLDTTQPNATWGIDRIDQRNLPLSGTYSYTPTGAGVTAYIIDTGIDFAAQRVRRVGRPRLRRGRRRQRR